MNKKIKNLAVTSFGIATVATMVYTIFKVRRIYKELNYEEYENDSHEIDENKIIIPLTDKEVMKRQKYITLRRDSLKKSS